MWLEWLLLYSSICRLTTTVAVLGSHHAYLKLMLPMRLFLGNVEHNACFCLYFWAFSSSLLFSRLWLLLQLLWPFSGICFFFPIHTSFSIAVSGLRIARSKGQRDLSFKRKKKAYIKANEDTAHSLYCPLVCSSQSTFNVLPHFRGGPPAPEH